MTSQYQRELGFDQYGSYFRDRISPFRNASGCLDTGDKHSHLSTLPTILATQSPATLTTDPPAIEKPTSPKYTPPIRISSTNLTPIGPRRKRHSPAHTPLLSTTKASSPHPEETRSSRSPTVTSEPSTSRQTPPPRPPSHINTIPQRRQISYTDLPPLQPSTASFRTRSPTAFKSSRRTAFRYKHSPKGPATPLPRPPHHRRGYNPRPFHPYHIKHPSRPGFDRAVAASPRFEYM